MISFETNADRMARELAEYNETINAKRNAAARKLAATLSERHAEAHRLIDKLTDMVDGINPDTADWGHAGDLGYVVDRLREITGEAGRS